MKKALISMSVILIMLSAVSCQKHRQYTMKKDYVDKPAHGDMFISAFPTDLITLNPILAEDYYSLTVINLIFNVLIKYDKDFNVVGDLAKKWVISPDGKTITFYLKKGVKWQDGAEFTAEDVKFTYDKFMDPKVINVYSSYFKPVDKVEAIDKYTVKVFYKMPFAPVLDTWTWVYILPKHLLQDKEFRTAGFNRKPIGTGPYKLKEWDTAQKVVLTANKDYFDGEPYISGYTFMIIPEQSAQFMNLEAGNIDDMLISPDIYFTKAATKEFEQNFNKYNYSGFGYYFIGYNETNPLFADKKVRQALSYAVNINEIINGTRRQGLAKIITGPFLTESWAYDTKVRGYGYNPEKALKLLAEEGWKREKDGFLYKNGKKFAFTLLVSQGYNEVLQTATIIQQQLAKLGIEAEVRVLAFNVLWGEYVDKQKFDAVLTAWIITIDPDYNYNIWHSATAGNSEFNIVSYKNPEVDRLFEQGRITCNKNKRTAIYHKIHELIAEDCPYTFLYEWETLEAASKRFHGMAPGPAGIWYNFTKWYVPAEIQKYKAAQ